MRDCLLSHHDDAMEEFTKGQNTCVNDDLRRTRKEGSEDGDLGDSTKQERLKRAAKMQA